MGFDGLISDVRIYNGLLSCAEVKALASSSVVEGCPHTPQLKAWYPLADDTLDKSGNGVDGKSRATVSS